MKKILLWSVGLMVVLGVGFVAVNVYLAQRADFGWDASVAEPVYPDKHPLVVIDEAHHNASTAGWSGRYWPFGRLLRNDGYDVRRGRELIAEKTLRNVDVLVIANAAGAPKPQLFGINLPVSTDKKRSDPAFTAQEVEAMQAWVRGGGSLLLIADHAPFGSASAGLAAAFGVTMHQGFAEVPDEVSDPLLFSDDNHRLGTHPVLTGQRPGTSVHRVMTFTGQSLDGPPDAAVLLRLPESAVEYVPKGDSLVPIPSGNAQGLALEYGSGRVVILGEAGMLTAQVAGGEPFGMNLPGNDNRQFALNIMHWLSRAL